MKLNCEVTAERLRELLSYSKSTGEFKWRADRGRCKAGEIAGWLNKHGYIQIRIDGVRYSAHRLAWLYAKGSWPVNLIDHKNGLRADNRLKNLREATVVTNAQNEKGARRHNQCGFLGVAYSKPHDRFVARIRHSGKRHTLGYRKTAEEAYELYLAAKRKHHKGNTL